MDHYSEHFYTSSWQRAAASARQVVPLIVRLTDARSVIDVGCGVGAWLEAFRDVGVGDIMGVDGAHVKQQLLRIAPDAFQVHDLSQPLRLARTFDLAICLEVAEHLPRAAADRFVGDLTRLAPVIVFSAAVPGQGGTHHVNEQWPEYWAALFKARAFTVVDCLRPAIWENEAVEFFYAQNVLVFVASNRLDRYPLLKAEEARRRGEPLSRIHPRRWAAALDPRQQSISALLRMLGLALMHRTGVR